MDLKWEDIGTVYERMKGRRLLEQQASPGTVPGHLLSVASFARAQRRQGSSEGARAVLRWYAEFKGIDEEALRREIEALWRDSGYWYGSAESIVEELSRV